MSNEKKVVTKIEIQKNNGKRVNVYINQEFAFACSTELIYMYNIVKGKNLELENIKEIVDQDNYIKCKSLALKIIERSYKTEKQVVDKLVRKEYGNHTIDRVVDFLKKYKFLDDEKFIRTYIDEKIKSQGKNKIRCALIKKGIDKLSIESELEKIDALTEKKYALKLARKKYDVVKKTGVNYKKIYKKLGNYLISRGYNVNIIKDVLNDVIDKDECEHNTKSKKEQDLNSDLNTLRIAAERRYNIISKSESDSIKIYRKLCNYLLRKGYSYENIRTVLKSIINLKGDTV
ncbi:recombination regulator RecX [Clostridium sp. JN-1]|uniref:recombination regulator RecX n=1 Tax=Clostridium sp. JN-1 TaxID=2483110 RepID=UPI000F0BA5BA|nr:recombination regulator RecX [Clostridium sp. JN-1]